MLVYFTQSANLSIQSLKQTGYSGDTKIIADIKRPREAKTKILDHISGYDRVMYSDSNVLFRKNPETLTQPSAEVSRIRIESFGPYLYQHERQHFGKLPAFNTRLLFIPLNSEGQQFFKIWAQYMEALKADRDQLILNLIWMRHYPFLQPLSSTEVQDSQDHDSDFLIFPNQRAMRSYYELRMEKSPGK